MLLRVLHSLKARGSVSPVNWHDGTRFTWGVIPRGWLIRLLFGSGDWLICLHRHVTFPVPCIGEVNGPYWQYLHLKKKLSLNHRLHNTENLWCKTLQRQWKSQTSEVAHHSKDLGSNVKKRPASTGSIFDNPDPALLPRTRLTHHDLWIREIGM